MKRAETLQELAQKFRAAIAEQPYAAMWSIVQEGVGDRITSGAKTPHSVQVPPQFEVVEPSDLEIATTRNYRPSCCALTARG